MVLSVEKLLKCVALVFAILCGLNGCDMINSMDRQNILYNDQQYDVISPPIWEINDPDTYITKSLNSDGDNVKIRLYKCDPDRKFIYCENNALLYHNNQLSFPANDTNNIDYLCFRDARTGNDTIINSQQVIENFIDFLTNDTVLDVNMHNNVCSVLVYYKNYPAHCFIGNIIVDKQGKYWLDFHNEQDFIELEKTPKLLSLLNSVLHS